MSLSTADKQQIDLLQRKIEQQRVELLERSELIQGVQRNFETLSEMYKGTTVALFGAIA